MGVRRAVQEGGDVWFCVWLIPVDVWQKPTQFCEAIILQSKKKLKREREREREGTKPQRNGSHKGA